jgi:type IV pilus assembly protein PilW
MGRIQETARTAFEMLSRDIREAGGNPCDSSSSSPFLLDNRLNDFSTVWWSNWNSPSTAIAGYGPGTAFPDDGFDTGSKTPGKRVPATDAIEFKSAIPVMSSLDAPASLSASMSGTSDDLTVNSIDGITNGDILMLCDYAHGTIFQATGLAGNKISHAATGTPGNTSGSFAPNVYKTTTATTVAAQIGKLRASRWYVGYNNRGGTSLFLTSLRNSAGVPTLATDEITEGVDDLSLEYLPSDSDAYTTAPADWGKVKAVKIVLDMSGPDKIGTDGNALQRRLQHIVALRNRAL